MYWKLEGTNLVEITSKPSNIDKIDNANNLGRSLNSNMLLKNNDNANDA